MGDDVSIINAAKLHDIGTIVSIGLFTAIPGIMLFAWTWDKLTALLWKIDAWIARRANKD